MLTGTRAVPPGIRGSLTDVAGWVGDVWEVNSMDCVNRGREGWSKKGQRGFFQCHPVIQHTSSLPLSVILSLRPSGISLPLLITPFSLSYPLPLNILSRRQVHAFFSQERSCHIYECSRECKKRKKETDWVNSNVVIVTVG